MAFKELTDFNAETTIALGGVDKASRKPNPTSVEGYYLATKTVQGKKGPCKLHIFQTPDGNIGVWGKTDMNRKLEQVRPGTDTDKAFCLRVSFKQMVDTPRGEMYQYKVEKDSDNWIEIDAAAPAPESPAEEQYQSDDPETDLDADEESYETPVPAPKAARPGLPAAAPDAERQARVKALLASRVK